MSLKAMLRHRCIVLRLTRANNDGAASFTWTVVATNQRCRADLSFARRGKDPGWTEEAGRAKDRTGVFFCSADSVAKVGDRVTITTRAGLLLGTFSLDGALDSVPGHDGEIHHLEIGIVEVPAALAQAVTP